MKRSTLREVVRTLANRKLAEYATICHGENGKCIDPALEEIATEPATGRVPKPPKAKFAYIVNRDDPKDPRMQLIGYGNMPVSYFKKMVLDGLDRMSTAADRGKYDAVISQWNNITKFVVNGLAEVDGVTELAEFAVQPKPSATGIATAAPVISADDKLAPGDQEKLVKIEQEKAKATQDLESTKGELAKKTEPYAKKISKLEKRVGDLNTAAERIKK